MRVLIVGDSPRLNTGFARVNREAAKAFMDAGWEVGAAEALMTGVSDSPTDGIHYFPPVEGDDMMARKASVEAFNSFKPDIVYLTGDPGSFVAYISIMPVEAKILGYIPIEGEPIPNEFWKMALSNFPFFTCSKYGADVVKKYLNRDVAWVYHGVEHQTFRPLDNREEIRKSIGWDDKFIVMCVANNVKRKQIPRLIESMSILKNKYKRKNIYLYLHTVPFQGHWLEGHNLAEIAMMYGVSELVMFNSKMKKLHDGIQEDSNEPGNPGLVQLYNAADLFVLPSQVEGFGLPIAEAMACGLPAMVTKYAAGWEVASPAGRGINVKDWDVHKSGTLYANVDPEYMASEINRLSKNPKELARMSQAGLERVKDYNWDSFRKVLLEQAEVVINASGSREAEQANPS